jgi:hypothetical protein
MDRGTKLMMALSSMLGALGVAGIVIFALSVGYGRFSSSMVVLLVCSLMAVYSCYILQKCISLAKDFEKTHGIIRLIAGVELVLFTIEWVFVSQLASQPMVLAPMILQLIFFGIILVQMNKAVVAYSPKKKSKARN